MNLLKICAMGAILFIVAACATNKAPLKMTKTVTPTSPIENGDYYAKRRAAGEDLPERRGSEFIEIRTYHKVATEKNGQKSTKREELTDVNCILKGDGFRAEFITPAQIEVPDYGYASSSLRIECKHPGYNTAFHNTKPYDIDKESRMNSSTSGGLLGVFVVAAINAADDEKNNNFGYRPADILLIKKEEASE